MNWPAELKVSAYSGPDLTPSPACLAAAATGDVYVGVDMIGSLGKKPGRGMIMKLEDRDNDGIMDHHSEYAAVDNPRGILCTKNMLRNSFNPVKFIVAFVLTRYFQSPQQSSNL
jgi:hypothetical protein